MRSEEFSKIRSLENTHWWYQGRRQLLLSLIRTLFLHDALILDAGCGTGFAGRVLSGAGRVVSLDASPDAFNQSSYELPTTACLARIEAAPFADSTFDLIVSLDVLEHLEDDTTALREMNRVCKPGGYLLVTVPACDWLWSPHDEVLGHHRRYSLSELRGKTRKAGFAVARATYLVSSIFPAAVIYRLIRRTAKSAESSSDLFPVPSPVNSVLASVMKAEASLFPHVSFPFGLTAAVLARKVVK